MSRLDRFLFFGSFVLSLMTSACNVTASLDRSATSVRPPVAERHPKTITVHGDSRIDDYFWLREKDNPKVAEYLKAEDAFAETSMKPVSALQETLYREMVGHIKETDETAPYRRGNYFYYS